MSAALREIDWSKLLLDGAITKARLGGEKTKRNPTDRGNSGVKCSLLTDVIDGANRHDMKLAEPMLESLEMARSSLLMMWPQGL